MPGIPAALQAQFSSQSPFDPANFKPVDNIGGKAGAAILAAHPGSSVVKNADGYYGIQDASGNFIVQPSMPEGNQTIGEAIGLASMFLGMPSTFASLGIGSAAGAGLGNTALGQALNSVGSVVRPAMGAYNVASGIENGNIGQAVGGALSFPGVGSAVNGLVGSGLSDIGVPTSLLPAATGATIGGGTAALSGGNIALGAATGAANGAGIPRGITGLMAGGFAQGQQQKNNSALLAQLQARIAQSKTGASGGGGSNPLMAQLMARIAQARAGG